MPSSGQEPRCPPSQLNPAARAAAVPPGQMLRSGAGCGAGHCRRCCRGQEHQSSTLPHATASGSGQDAQVTRRNGAGTMGGGGWSWSMRRLRGHPGAAVAARSPGSDPGGGGAAGVPCGMGTQDELPLSQPHCCPPLPRAGPCAGALPQGRAALPRQRGCAAAGSEHWHRPGEGHNTPPPPRPWQRWGKGLSRMGSLGLEGRGGASGRGEPGISAPSPVTPPPTKPCQHPPAPDSPGGDNRLPAPPPCTTHTLTHLSTACTHTPIACAHTAGSVSSTLPPELCSPPPQEKGPDTAGNLYIIYIYLLFKNKPSVPTTACTNYKNKPLLSLI